MKTFFPYSLPITTSSGKYLIKVAGSSSHHGSSEFTISSLLRPCIFSCISPHSQWAFGDEGRENGLCHIWSECPSKQCFPLSHKSPLNTWWYFSHPLTCLFSRWSIYFPSVVPIVTSFLIPPSWPSPLYLLSYDNIPLEMWPSAYDI